MAYGDFKEQLRRTTSEKQLQIKCSLTKYLILLKNPNKMDIKEVLLLWFINF